jgi:hypothetical protein
VSTSQIYAEDQIKPGLTEEHVKKQSDGCISCHTTTDAFSMHKNPAVHIGCADCHGGNPEIFGSNLTPKSEGYIAKMEEAHVLPKNKELWKTSRNPENSYADLLKESYEFVKFINPGDLRVNVETCGGCHGQVVDAVPKSLMSTSAMLWGGASYNNNILPFKKYVLGESYDRDGKPREIVADTPTDAEAKRGALKKLVPLPQWEVTTPGDIFRVFERGGLFIKSQFAEVGIPNPFEDPGKPDIKASNRGPGTGGRISVPVLNIHKTRLNDPHLSLMGTNDHAGDYRSSGCTGCHVIYANDRDPRHSGPYSQYGNEGKSQTVDPTIDKNESGHPIKHEFSRAIPTSQCMVCHMHQPNMFVNSYLGYTMWDYETGADLMWPKKQKYPTDEEKFETMLHNPEAAAARGNWSDKDFLKTLWELNPKVKDTQFADYHGHGWNFRAIYKRDRKGHLLDENDKIVSPDDPKRFKKAVHLADIHVDKGLQCMDCHFSQDGHGDGKIYGEVAQQVEIQCQDCHGTLKEKATLRTSGPAAPEGGRDLSLMRTGFGEARFQWRNGDLYQRSSVTPGLEWRVSQVRDSINPKSPFYNKKSARAKTVERYQEGQSKEKWGDLSKIDGSPDLKKILAHADDKMSCFTCHSSWVTSCGGCHLPIEANWKAKSKHYDGKETRNLATYNPQVARDDMFQLGIHGPAKDGKIVPVRSSSALVLSSTDSNRQKIYVQQPPTSAGGYSSQAFAPHFPHTVRTKETKGCTDCHISKDNDNNAIMAQLLLMGTQFVNFMGYHTYVGTQNGFEAIQVTEWEEPQAVIGSYLHRYAYPDFYKTHQDHNKELETSHTHEAEGGAINTVQLRGEYLYTTAGEGGFRVFDVANVANKGFSERLVTAPFSPLGQDTHVPSKNAKSFSLPTNMPVAPFREQLPENLETPMHPIYHYAAIADAEEGLILVNVDTLQDGDPTNNFLERALTWNQDNLLTGAQYITLAGSNAFIATKNKIIILDLDKPLEPKVIVSIPYDNPTAVAIQFRYAFVTDAKGMHVLDITTINQPRKVEKTIPLTDARNIYLARTYAYISGGSDGMVIVDIEKPEAPKIYGRFGKEFGLTDTNDIKIATTNASLFAYVADGKNGLSIFQLTDPERVPGFYGFTPEVKPLLISHRKTEGAVFAISKPLDRDRAVDETGNQVSVFGRIGSRPFNKKEMESLFLLSDKRIYTVEK